MSRESGIRFDSSHPSDSTPVSAVHSTPRLTVAVQDIAAVQVQQPRARINSNAQPALPGQLGCCRRRRLLARRSQAVVQAAPAAVLCRMRKGQSDKASHRKVQPRGITTQLPVRTHL